MRTRQKLERLLDDKIRDICRIRDSRCITCLTELTKLNRTVGHFMKRRHLGTRWSVLNCWGQCADCNNRDDDRKFEIALAARLGKPAVNKLRAAAHAVTKYSQTDLREILIELKIYERGLNGQNNNA